MPDHCLPFYWLSKNVKAQVDLNHCWAHMSEGMFSDIAAEIINGTHYVNTPIQIY